VSVLVPRWVTNRITDLLPTRSMRPGTMPAVAVFADVDDAMLTVLDEVEDGLAAEAEFFHDAGLW